MCGALTLSSPSTRFPIAYMEIRVFSHATEDSEKVKTSVRNMLPETFPSDIAFTKTNCVGHHGNPIVLMETRLTERSVLLWVLEGIGSRLSSLDKEQMGAEVKQHIEKHNLYLRFDKHNAFLGCVKLGSNDPIHFKVHFKNKGPEEIIAICRQAGLLP